MTSAIGIDVGKSGGFAWKIGEVVGCQKMPPTDSEILALLGELQEVASDSGLPKPEIFLEKVGGFIGTPQTGHSMFNFGRGYGFLIGGIMALKFRLTLVRPQQWQKDIGAGTKGERSTTQWKNHLKDIAARLYPDQKITLSVADAFLILESGTMKKGGG